MSDGRATAATAAANRSVALPESDEELARVRRGLVGGPLSPAVAGAFGGVIWDLGAYGFLEGTCPPTVHPGLWRQARLLSEAGLFTVVPGVHQVRGLDVSNVTFIEGRTGWVVIDPLTAAETAAAAYELVTHHFGRRPVRAVLYTHPHLDHFGGCRGLLDAAESPDADIVAPAGFTDAAVAENALVGPAMLRRGTYMYGTLLEVSATGHVSTGLGIGLPRLPTVALVVPTREVTATGEVVTLDGVEIEVQLTPDAEAPVEMALYLRRERALCAAEICTATLHNVYTPRGALVRDALAWSKHLDDALALFGDRSDVVFASHHWPRWGRDGTEHLARQRDLYRYVHDESVRLMNHGLTLAEVAEAIDDPPALTEDPANRGYYGTVRHNAKGVYQRYLGWFDGHPAHLDPHPPEAAARRYVEFMGGRDALLELARASYEAGDYRWVAEVVHHAVFADPTDVAARELEADALEQLGFQAESGPWRDFYLTGAMELRRGGTPLRGMPALGVQGGLTAAAPSERLFDLWAVRLNGPAARDLTAAINVTVTDRGEQWRLTVGRGVLTARPGAHPAPDVVVAVDHETLAALATGRIDVDGVRAAHPTAITGDVGRLAEVLARCDEFTLGFEIVVP